MVCITGKASKLKSKSCIGTRSPIWHRYHVHRYRS
jgi:hypothetical protein